MREHGRESHIKSRHILSSPTAEMKNVQLQVHDGLSKVPRSFTLRHTSKLTIFPGRHVTRPLC